MLQIVVAIIHDGEDFLIGKRWDQPDHPMQLGGEWSILGGRVEPGESWQQGLKREIMEEAGISVEIEKMLLTIKKPHKTSYFALCKALSRQVRTSEEIVEFKWLSRFKVLDNMGTHARQALPQDIQSFFTP